MNKRMTDIPTNQRKTAVEKPLRIVDLRDAMGTCGGCDPGPDPTYDPEPIPLNLP